MPTATPVQGVSDILHFLFLILYFAFPTTSRPGEESPGLFSGRYSLTVFSSASPLHMWMTALHSLSSGRTIQGFCIQVVR